MPLGVYLGGPDGRMYNLLPVESVDAALNVTKAENDYGVVQIFE